MITMARRTAVRSSVPPRCDAVAQAVRRAASSHTRLSLRLACVRRPADDPDCRNQDINRYAKYCKGKGHTAKATKPPTRQRMNATAHETGKACFDGKDNDNDGDVRHCPFFPRRITNQSRPSHGHGHGKGRGSELELKCNAVRLLRRPTAKTRIARNSRLDSRNCARRPPRRATAACSRCPRSKRPLRKLWASTWAQRSAWPPVSPEGVCSLGGQFGLVCYSCLTACVLGLGRPRDRQGVVLRRQGR